MPPPAIITAATIIGLQQFRLSLCGPPDLLDTLGRSSAVHLLCHLVGKVLLLAAAGCLGGVLLANEREEPIAVAVAVAVILQNIRQADSVNWL